MKVEIIKFTPEEIIYRIIYKYKPPKEVSYKGVYHKCLGIIIISKMIEEGWRLWIANYRIKNWNDNHG